MLGGVEFQGLPTAIAPARVGGPPRPQGEGFGEEEQEDGNKGIRMTNNKTNTFLIRYSFSYSLTLWLLVLRHSRAGNQQRKHVAANDVSWRPEPVEIKPTGRRSSSNRLMYFCASAAVARSRAPCGRDPARPRFIDACRTQVLSRRKPVRAAADAVARADRDRFEAVEHVGWTAMRR